MTTTSRTNPVPVKQPFTLPVEDLQKAIDVDDSIGRSVPSNMNFVEEAFLTKDTGVELFGATDAALRHSIFYYKKKNGTTYIISATGTKLQLWSGTAWVDMPVAYARTVTISIGTPAQVSLTAHGLTAGTPITFATTGALPTGMTAGTTYYVIATGLLTGTFQFSATLGGAAINTSGTQSGVQSVTVANGTFTNAFTAGAEFGWNVYNDVLHGGNAVESFLTFDGYTFTSYPTAPKGNILEIFEDRMFIAGSTTEPLTVYYSNVGIPTTFTSTDLVKPLGTDTVTYLKNFYGVLMIFKQNTIIKLTFEYDQVATLFLPKLASQSANYGACGRKAVCPVENDLWFFTGREVRALGYQSNNSGVFGINADSISENIKDTLKLILSANYTKVAVFYQDHRYYLSVPITASTNDTVFVCHTLFNKSWTKYTGRDKAKANDFLVIDSIIYTTVASGSYGSIKWNTGANDTTTSVINKETFTTDPAPRGWQIGTGWAWDATNHNMHRV